jgi:DNA-binding CsgD family transcriptional regulator
MDSPSIAKAVASATPDVNALLDRHARWSAQMCRNVPSLEGRMCQNMPSRGEDDSAKHAQTCQNVPEHAQTCHREESDETNPPASASAPRPLTERQRMAARMIVYGYRSGEIAQQLRVNRHTVAIWKRNPAFRVELNRLHAYATAAVISEVSKKPAPAAVAAAGARVTPPAPARRRMTRAEIEQEDRECEALVAQLLQAKATREAR